MHGVKYKNNYTINIIVQGSRNGSAKKHANKGFKYKDDPYFPHAPKIPHKGKTKK